MSPTPRIYIATTNPGKLREFQEAAHTLDVDLAPLPGLKDLPAAVEDGPTFAANASIKAEYYSRFVPAELVLAEDSGLSVDELNGSPGVYSARYAAMVQSGAATNIETQANADDQANNRALIAELERLPAGKHLGRYICVIALARDGNTLTTFTGEVEGELLTTPRGTAGFGYDPLFYFPALGKTFAELKLEEKRLYSHRGNAFRRFLEWYARTSPHSS